ncbi:MAG: hypothetical protein ACRC35_07940, partial [Angustibacter sp.]
LSSTEDGLVAGLTRAATLDPDECRASVADWTPAAMARRYLELYDQHRTAQVPSLPAPRTAPDRAATQVGPRRGPAPAPARTEQPQATPAWPAASHIALPGPAS